MAILSEVEVTISANGNELQEYDEDAGEQNTSNTVTNYIEALTGADFRIDYHVKPTFQHTSSSILISIRIDGQWMDGHVLAKNKELINLSRRAYSNSFMGARRAQDGEWNFQRFSFAEIETSRLSSFMQFGLLLTYRGEDAVNTTDQNLKELISKLGVIRIEVHRSETKGNHATSNGPENFAAMEPFPEKALKGQALSHRARLGPLQQVTPWKTAYFDYIDGIDSPFAVFNFKYCSRKALQGMLIIPRTPSPVPLEQRPLNQLTHEEALELLRRRSIQAKSETKPAVTLKREHDELDPERKHDEEYVALLASARTQKAARVQEPIEVIDLLDD